MYDVIVYFSEMMSWLGRVSDAVQTLSLPLLKCSCLLDALHFNSLTLEPSVFSDVLLGNVFRYAVNY